jgi:PIN domain nuclease of toxin-antitoxin system
MIVLDTHAWVWWTSDPAKLGRLARREIERSSRIGVPTICALEIAVGVRRGRLSLDRPTLEWLQDALAQPRVEALTLSPAVAVKAADLPPTFPGDPADRVIAASAILHSAALVTKDERIRAFDGVRCVWS